jgi:hypothetical protein
MEDCFNGEDDVDAMDTSTKEPDACEIHKHSVAVDSGNTHQCWMCNYHGNVACDKAVLFIVDAISHMSLPCLVTQLHTRLSATFPDENISSTGIMKHIREHMLHPRVKTAVMIHRLCDMQSAITQNIVSHDTESMQTIIDGSAVKLYTTLTNQIAGLYKLDEEKLMFRNISMDK